MGALVEVRGVLVWTVGGGRGRKPCLRLWAGLAGAAGSFLAVLAQSQALAVEAWPLPSLPAPPPSAARLAWVWRIRAY